jgi:hypothetical protein
MVKMGFLRVFTCKFGVFERFYIGNGCFYIENGCF